MTQLAHAGIGWPNGAVSNEAIAALPTDSFLMLATEGRYHHDWLRQRRPDARILWRSIPRIGKRPAELGWSPSKFVTEALNLTDEPTLPITDFVFANELDLNSERGDGADDWSGLDKRYALIGGWALSVVQGLQAWLPGTRIHWPAWTPDHLALDYLSLWKPAADACQVVDFHGYDSLDKIRGEYTAYRRAFPHKPLALTEWHCKGDVDEERRVLSWLAETMTADPLFEAAYFFIWRWWNHPGWWDDAWDIEHSPARLDLFLNPPTVSLPAPIPTPEPIPEPIPVEPAMPTPKTREEVIAISNAVADEVGIPQALLLACGIAESNLRWNARRPSSPDQDGQYWPDVSPGVWQQAVRWSQEYAAWCRDDAPGHNPGDFPGTDVTTAVDVHYFDVEHAARVAAAQLKAKLQQAMAA